MALRIYSERRIFGVLCAALQRVDAAIRVAFMNSGTRVGWEARHDPGAAPAVLESPLRESYGYDGYNRGVRVTEANGVTTGTEYDALGRVRGVIRKGATAAGDER